MFTQLSLIYCDLATNIAAVYLDFYSYEYHDNTLLLKFPRLINFLETYPVNSSSVFELNQPNISLPSYKPDNLSRSGKKYKENIYARDDLSPKKSKIKSPRKKHGTIDHTNKVNIFIDDGNRSIISDPPDFSIRKSRKPTTKVKQENINRFSNYVSIKTSVDSKNSACESHTLTSDKLGKDVFIEGSLTVNQLSLKLDIPEAEIIKYLFLDRGISVTVNELLDVDISKDVALNYNFNILDEFKTVDKYISLFKPLSNTIGTRRSPVVTILGHVDHGKTTLVGSIMRTNLVKHELGGITQSMFAYELDWCYRAQTYTMVFLDTPGHESFKSMRLRGAKIADIALLVIAIDDGLKQQTLEAINYIQEMDLSCIIVLTKADKDQYNIDHILRDLASHDLVVEQWGGKVPLVQVSAITNKNIDNLLSKICSICENENFVTNLDVPASGIVLESYLDKKQGSTANILLREGTLNVGTIIASDSNYGKVKSVINLSNQKIKKAYALSVFQILGFSGLPQAGSLFKAFSNDKEAKKFCESFADANNHLNFSRVLNNRVSQTLDSNVKQINLLLKADTQGSMEAIVDLLSNIPQTKVQLNITLSGFGSLSSNDIELAIATKSLIIAFNVDIPLYVLNSSKKCSITCKLFNIIYDLSEYVKILMLNLIEVEYDKVLIGQAIVKTVFNLNRGSVAGCYVDDGKLKKSCHICIYRQNELVYQGLINSLKRIKNDVDEVVLGNECGLMSDYNYWQQGDLIKAYNLIAKPKSL